MRNVSDKSCRKIKIKFYIKKLIFEKPDVYEIRWKNTVERGRPQKII
jgi:hypothetical protein